MIKLCVLTIALLWRVPRLRRITPDIFDIKGKYFTYCRRKIHHLLIYFADPNHAPKPGSDADGALPHPSLQTLQLLPKMTKVVRWRDGRPPVLRPRQPGQLRLPEGSCCPKSILNNNNYYY